MGLRRRTNIHQIGLFVPQHFCDVTVSARNSKANRDVLRGSKVQVADRNQLRFVPQPLESWNVLLPGDQAGTDNGSTDSLQSILPNCSFHSKNLLEITVMQDLYSTS